MADSERHRRREGAELLPGTLDLLVLRTLRIEPLHGYGIARRIVQLSRGAFEVPGGSLFPALYRLERDGFLDSSWSRTQTGRRAKFYQLTRSGRRKLERETEKWERAASGIRQLLEAT